MQQACGVALEFSTLLTKPLYPCYCLFRIPLSIIFQDLKISDMLEVNDVLAFSQTLDLIASDTYVQLLDCATSIEGKI